MSVRAAPAQSELRLAFSWRFEIIPMQEADIASMKGPISYVSEPNRAHFSNTVALDKQHTTPQWQDFVSALNPTTMARRIAYKLSPGAGMGLASLILIAGAVVLMFFVVLSGVTNSTPLNKTYFLQADTGSISGARPVSQWTFFYICGSGNRNCGKPVPALPFGYAWSSHPTGAPDSLVG